MAQYNHLPIYKTAYDLLLELMNITKNYPREFKFSLGEKIQNAIVELLLNIYKANSSRDKKVFLLDIIEQIQYINILVRISKDLKIIPVERYAKIIVQTSSIAKQAQGWMNSIDVI